MDTKVAARGEPVTAARSAVFLGYDAIATIGGLYGALLLCGGGEISPDAASVARAAVPVLLFIRLAAVLLGRLHKWSFRHCTAADGTQLAALMLAASAVFAFTVRVLPPGVYVLEFVLTTGAMAAFRFAPNLTVGNELQVSLGIAKLKELEGPRRVLNVVVALLGMALTLPLWVVIAVAIKLTSRGPVLYKQERVGIDFRSLPTPARWSDPSNKAQSEAAHNLRKHDLGGRPFVMYKFRTMRVDAESSTGAVWARKCDPRVTPIGGFLRHTRLDELPQLINVLKGDMNIVGPRPERPTIFAELRSRIPEYQLRQRARPGITGYAQVNLEADSSVEDVAHKLTYDLEYLSRQSVVTDLAIMAKTFPVMLFRDRLLSARAKSTVREDRPADTSSARPRRPARPDETLPTVLRRDRGWAGKRRELGHEGLR